MSPDQSLAKKMKPLFRDRFPSADISNENSNLRLTFDNKSWVNMQVSRDPSKEGQPVVITPYFHVYEKSIGRHNALNHWGCSPCVVVTNEAQMNELIQRIETLSSFPIDYEPMNFADVPYTHFEEGGAGQITVWAGNVAHTARVLGIWNLDLEKGIATDNVQVPGANPYFLVSIGGPGKNGSGIEVMYRDKAGWLPVIRSHSGRVCVGHAYLDFLLNLQDEQLLKKAMELYVRKHFGKQKIIELAS
jgi:hypothetical protein